MGVFCSYSYRVPFDKIVRPMILPPMHLSRCLSTLMVPYSIFICKKQHLVILGA